jgi:UDP-hydrolysing UDP-N-acetyl-D-glucosamine 2-epimerase
VITIGVVTSSRADYGILRPLLHRIGTEPSVTLRLLVTGMHLSPEHGYTVREIEADGFAIEQRIENTLSSDTPTACVQAIALGLFGFAQVLARMHFDVLVVLGDRFDMYPAALAALPFRIPVAHIHGGELTEGAIDDALRHSMTKLSHLHFVATEDYARRVEQMGEEPWRICTCGALGLDNIKRLPRLPVSELESRLEMSLSTAPCLVTFHPATLERDQVPWQVAELLAALEGVGRPVVFTMPNSDPAGRSVAKAITEFLKRHPEHRLVDSLGTQAYFGLMEHAAVMVGNSSSGLIEAPSFGLPVVNIGTRQQGRLRGRNVIDVGYGRSEVRRGIDQALEPGFRRGLTGMVNPYGDGAAADRIVQHIREALGRKDLISKHFFDQPSLQEQRGARNASS